MVSGTFFVHKLAETQNSTLSVCDCVVMLQPITKQCVRPCDVSVFSLGLHWLAYFLVTCHSWCIKNSGEAIMICISPSGKTLFLHVFVCVTLKVPHTITLSSRQCAAVRWLASCVSYLELLWNMFFLSPQGVYSRCDLIGWYVTKQTVNCRREYIYIPEIPVDRGVRWCQIAPQ